MHERKKNEYDPIANPVYFFRRDMDDKADVDLDCLATKTIQKRDMTAPNNEGLLKKSMMLTQQKEEAEKQR